MDSQSVVKPRFDYPRQQRYALFSMVVPGAILSLPSAWFLVGYTEERSPTAVVGYTPCVGFRSSGPTYRKPAFATYSSRESSPATSCGSQGKTSAAKIDLHQGQRPAY
ncbi:MAG: hypothetical protein GXP08_07180 [Gammaproteobacteria bacterium]|nr:hypothetical protein [Gammaproteobacteria bacterium]